MKKIIIVKMSALGDIVHLFPTLEYLRSRFPSAAIHWIVEEASVALPAAHPYVDEVIPIATKAWRKRPFERRTWRELRQAVRILRGHTYDVVFDFQGNSKSALITALLRADVKVGFGKRSVAEWPNLLVTNRQFSPPMGQNIRDDYLFLARSFCGDQAPFTEKNVALQTTEQQRAHVAALLEVSPKYRKVVVSPGATWRNKQMDIASLCRQLHKLKREQPTVFFFIWGSAQERELAERCQRAFSSDAQVMEKLEFPALQYLMAHVDLVVAMDSFPLHLAGTTATATLSFFGPSSAEKYRPFGSHHHSIQGKCPYGVTFVKRCPRLRSCPTGACIRDHNSADASDCAAPSP